ncbi:MAG: hypothetical protein HC779_08945 [Phyllobacteriaceae bacterium]|nr:hypothetical protein [Phyllobacteriaceae bacterium]
MLAQGKDTSKKLLKYHRIPVPAFEVYPIGRKPTRKPRRMKYPMIVKSTTEDGSYGISQASVVSSQEQLEKRVKIEGGRIAEYRVRLRLVFDMAPETVLHW